MFREMGAMEQRVGIYGCRLHNVEQTIYNAKAESFENNSFSNYSTAAESYMYFWETFELRSTKIDSQAASGSNVVRVHNLSAS